MHDRLRFAVMLGWLSCAGAASARAGDALDLSKPFDLWAQQTESTREPETTVTAEKLSEERPVGENNQPEWTTRRRFPTTRVYVLPPFQVEFEQWWRGRNFRHDSTKHRFQTEMGIGLPYRFQLDYYENFERAPHEELKHLGSQVEARWALANWGEIPMNPTVYVEWKFNDVESDVYELKLLLGDEITSGWHWASNVAFEQVVREDRAIEAAVSGAISHTLIDEKLSLGIETVFRHETTKDSRNHPELSFLVGPSLQWRLTPRTHLDFLPLLGIGGDSPQAEAYVVFGVDLGPSDAHEVGAPISTKSK